MLVLAVALTLYIRGSARTDPPVPRSCRLAFHLAIPLLYLALQTSWDYYASHMFFVHRLQRFILHDVGPALLAGSVPAGVLAKGLPAGLADPVARLIFEPWTATVLY